MAFGKDPRHLGNVAPFGGSTRQQAAFATRRRKRSGGSKLIFKNQFQPSLYYPDTINVIPGEYWLQFLDDSGNLVEGNFFFFNYMEHFHGVFKKSCFCSAGPYRFQKKHATPCRGCDIYWEDWNIRKSTGNRNKPRRMSMREMYAYTIIDHGVFHEVEDTDPQGNIKVNPSTQQPYTSWEKCTGQQCQGCALGKKTKTGHVQPWPMGKRHFGTLNAYDDQIGLGCVTCGSRVSITTTLWHCGNPECGEPLIDMTNTGLNPEQLHERINEPQRCPRCQQSFFMKDIYECAICTPQGAAAQRATIFDVPMQVRRQKNPDEEGTQLLVVGVGDPQPLNPAFSEIAKPLKLNEMYGPTDLSLQAGLFQIQPQQPAPPQGAPGVPPQGAQQYQQPGTPQQGAEYGFTPQGQGQPPQQ